MQQVRYKVLRRDDGQVFGPFVLGGVVPPIGGNKEYMLVASEPDTFGAELCEGDRVSFTSDEGFGGEGQIVFDNDAFSVKNKNNGCLLRSCRFLKRLGSVYDKEVSDAGFVQD
jgi:hypothetical protein